MGRRLVRAMIASMSRSTTQLIVLAEPAASVPPTRVASSVQPDGQPRAASTMTGTVVTSSSSMIRGLVSATYALITSSGDRRPAIAAAVAEVTGMRLRSGRIGGESRLRESSQQADDDRCGGYGQRR